MGFGAFTSVIDDVADRILGAVKQTAPKPATPVQRARMDQAAANWTQGGSIERERDVTSPEQQLAQDWTQGGDMEQIRDRGLEGYLGEIRRQAWGAPQYVPEGRWAGTQLPSLGAQQFAAGMLGAVGPATGTDEQAQLQAYLDVLNPYRTGSGYTDQRGFGTAFRRTLGPAADYLGRYGRFYADAPAFQLQSPMLGSGAIGPSPASNQDVLTQEIPYAQQANDAIRARLERLAGPVGAVPGLGQVQRYGERTAGVPTISGTIAGVASSILPEQVWQLALELVPGIGMVPGTASFGRKFGATLLDQAAEAGYERSAKGAAGYLATTRGKAAARALAGEAGKLGPDGDAVGRAFQTAMDNPRDFTSAEIQALYDESSRLSPLSPADREIMADAHDLSRLSDDALFARLDQYQYQGGIQRDILGEMLRRGIEPPEGKFDVLREQAARRRAYDEELSQSGVTVQDLVLRAQHIARRNERGALGDASSDGYALNLPLRGTSAAAGGAAGATQGETPQERLRNALLGAGAGLGVSDIAIRGGIVDNVGRAVVRATDETGAAGGEIARLEREIAALRPRLQAAADEQSRAFFEKQIRNRQAEIEDLRGGQATLFDVPLGEGTQTKLVGGNIAARNAGGELELRSPTTGQGMFADEPQAIDEEDFFDDTAANMPREPAQPKPPAVDYNDRASLERRAAELEEQIAEAEPAARTLPQLRQYIADLRSEGESIRQRLVALMRTERGALGKQPDAPLPQRAIVTMDRLRLMPETFQAKETDEGLPWVRARVDRIAREYDPNQLTDLTVVPDRERGEGYYIVVGGHHRYGALQQLGKDEVPIRIIEQINGESFDIRNPTHVDEAKLLADADNATQYALGLKDRINSLRRFEEVRGTDDPEEIKRLYTAWNTESILTDQYISMLPAHVIDKLDKLDPKKGAGVLGIAAQVGRGRKVYRLTEQEVESLFLDFTKGTKGTMPTPYMVAEKMDRYGKVIKAKRDAEDAARAGFVTDMFGDVPADAFGAQNEVLDMMKADVALSREIKRARQAELRFIRDALARGMSEDDPIVKQAHAEVTRLEARQQALEDDLDAVVRAQNAVPDRADPEPLPAAALPGQTGLLDVEDQLDEMESALPAEGGTTEGAGSGGGDETAGGIDGDSDGKQIPKVRPLAGLKDWLPGQNALTGMAEAEQALLRPTAQVARDLEGHIGSALRPAAPPKAPRLSQVMLEKYLPARADFEAQSSRAAENVGRYRLRLRAVMTRARNEQMTQGQFGNLTQRAIKQAQGDVRRAVRLREQANGLLSKADNLVAAEDVIKRLREGGVDETDARIVIRRLEDEQRLIDADDPFLDRPRWAQRIQHVLARTKGSVPGVLHDIANARLGVRTALSLTTREFSHDVLPRYERIVQKALDSGALRFIGEEKNRAVFDLHPEYYLVRHPAEFTGKTPELRAVLDIVQGRLRSRYELIRRLDAKAAPPTYDAYLAQLWDYGDHTLERVSKGPRVGKPGQVKERAIKDWRKAILSDEWPYDLKDMTPGELVEYTLRAADEYVADMTERRAILRKYGEAVKPRRAEGLVEFRSPLYRGWWAKPEIVNMVDALHAPAPEFVDAAGGAISRARNTAFGFDFGVMLFNMKQALATGNTQFLIGMANRLAAAARLPHVDTAYGDGLVSDLSRSLDGLQKGGYESPFAEDSGTLLGLVPGMGTVDKKLGTALKASQRAQYGMIMSWVQDVMHDGALVLAKASGADISDPVVRLHAADNANAVVNTSRGAQRRGRATIEARAQTSARITRGQGALIGQLLNAVRPGATRTQRWTGAATGASMFLSVYAAATAINAMGGYPPPPAMPFKRRKDGSLAYDSGWATVTIDGRRHQIIPSRTLIRAIAEATAGIVNEDPAAVLVAMQNYGYNRTTPAGQMPLTLGAGWGYDPEAFAFTPGGLPMKERLKQGFPLPIGLENVIADRSTLKKPARLTESFFGGSSVPASQAVAEKAVNVADGNYRQAYDAALANSDVEAADGIRRAWRDDFEKRAAEFGLTVIPGDLVERPGDDLARGPRIEIASVEGVWKAEGWESSVRDQLVAAWDYPGEGSQRIKAIAAGLSGFDTMQDMRTAFVDAAALEYVRLYGGTIATARDELADDFNGLQEVKNFNKAKQYDRLEFWRQHPDVLHEAWLLGIEETNEAERKILEEAGYGG